jgi:hypothetical protein
MDNWQANFFMAQEIAGMMDRDDDTRARAAKPRVRLLPRIDVQGWIARLDAAAAADHDGLSAGAVQDAECA